MTTENDTLEIIEDKQEGKAEKKSVLADKSVEELISMNESAQQQISRQGNEIGELRNLTDEILRKQLEEKAPKKEAKEADWEYNPQEAAEELVNSKVDAIEAKLEKDQRQRDLESFADKHPNYKETSADETFREWITKSSYRTSMYERGNAGDLLAADELFTEWDNVKPKEDNDGISERDQKLKDAQMEKGGGTPKSKKIFRRSEIRNLRLTKPLDYKAREDEFHLAYKEGRVR